MVFFVFQSLSMGVIKLIRGRRRSVENNSCDCDTDGVGAPSYAVWSEYIAPDTDAIVSTWQVTLPQIWVGPDEWASASVAPKRCPAAPLWTVALNRSTFLFSPILHPPREPSESLTDSCRPSLNTWRTKLPLAGQCHIDLIEPKGQNLVGHTGMDECICMCVSVLSFQSLLLLYPTGREESLGALSCSRFLPVKRVFPCLPVNCSRNR